MHRHASVFSVILAFVATFVMAAGLYAPAAYAAPSKSVLPVVTNTAAGSGPELQFAASGHLVTFRPREVLVANGSYALHVEFAGAAPVAPRSFASLSRSGSAAPALQTVTYANLWDGITLDYEAVPGGLMRSTYRIEPGADPAKIRLRYNAPITLNENGTLAAAFDRGQINESAPIAWQEVKGQHVGVRVAFVQLAAGEAGFGVGEYDTSQPLFIDPTMTWNTFLGGSNQDYGNALAVDNSGNVYLAGFSLAAWGTPVRAYGGGASDAFVAKLDSAGNVIWNTFLGGTSGDNARGIAVDADGNVYITGNSSGTWGTPVRPFLFYTNAFAAKLDSNGTLQWNTFLGGTAWFDIGNAISVDGDGNVYLAGYSGATWGTPLQAFAGNYDGLVAKLNNSGTLLWHTYLGGSSYDYAYAISVDGTGNVYVGGSSSATWGTPVRAYSGASDGYVAKLNSDGAIQWNTFLGGTNGDDGYAIAVDGSGNTYIAGFSNATWGTPLVAYSASMDGFAAKLDSSGGLQWNTFLGGSGDEFAHALDVDGNGVYVTGRSSGTWGTPVQAHAGGDDVFAVKLDFAGALQWNTFLGGSGYDQGFGVATDGNNSIYIGGYAGAGWGTPIRSYAGGGDAFALRISDLPPASEIDVLGNGVSLTDGDTTPNLSDHTDFGSSALGDAPVVRTFTIQNIGDLPLTLGANAVALGSAGGNPFGITSQPAATVAPGGSTTFAVTFAPVTAGSFSDTITITNDDSNENPFTFMIQGAGYVSPNFFAQAHKFAAGDRGAFDVFGGSAAMAGDILVVGANGEDEDAAGSNSLLSAGAVYVFQRDAGGPGHWGQVRKIVPGDRGEGDQFGVSVAIDGDTIVVGANQEDEDSAGGDTRANAGSAYVFQRNQGGPDNWGQVRKIVAGDRNADDNFGVAVAISGDTIAVGASQEDEDAGGANTQSAAGSAYIFQRDQGGTDNWGQVKKLVAGDRAAFDQFGGSLNIDGDTVVVSAIGEDEDGAGANTLNNAGSAYVFQRNQGGAENWGQVKKLAAADRAVNDFFGISTAVDGDTVVVGAPVEDEDAAGANTLNSAGSAYVFQRNHGGTDNWGQVRKLVAGDRGADDQFGWRVDIDGDVIAVGAHQDDKDAGGANSLANAGSAYLFKRHQGGIGNWGQLQKIAAGDRGVEDHFGYSVAAAGDKVFVGAYFEDEDEYGGNTLDGAGSTYLFASSPPADLVLAKAVTYTRAAPGEAITYTLYFTNTGVGTAYGPVIRDSVPPSVTINAVDTSMAGSGVVIVQFGSAPDFAWSVSDLAAGQAGAITLTGVVGSGFEATTSITNTATITAGHDITAENNIAHASFTVNIDSPNQYTIALSASPVAGGSTSGGGSVIQGATVTVSAAPAAGYTFINWTEGGNEVATTATYVFTATGNRALVANFSPNSYSVSVESAGTGSGIVTLSPVSGPYLYGTTVTATAAADPDSEFVGWSADCAGVGPCTLTMDANKHIVATFTRVAGEQSSVAITKRASVSEAIVGETAIVYTYVITNTGASAIDVSAVDDRLGAVPLVLLPPDVPQYVRTLAAGQAATGVLTYTPQLNDLPGPLTNRVVVTGTTASGGVPVTAQASASVNLQLRGQPQSMCMGDSVVLHAPFAGQGFGLVVIRGPVPPGLVLSGVVQCVPYVDQAAMVDLINDLFAQHCAGGSACGPFTYIVFDPDGSSHSETITGEMFVADIFLPLIRSSCGSGANCP